jgi:ABC-2 type transport system permease protein
VVFTSNVFVKPQTKPEWLNTLVGLNPVSHLITAERGLMNGTATPSQVGWALVASIVLLAVFALLTMRLYRRKH